MLLDLKNAPVNGEEPENWGEWGDSNPRHPGPQPGALSNWTTLTTQNLKPDQIIKLRRYFLEHPAIKPIYDFKQKLVKLLLIKKQTQYQCKRLIPVLLDYIQQLKNAIFEPLVTLGKTLESWLEEVARMWRFTKSNGITEGFHNKMKTIQKRAYGFKNFENYRLRVRALCC